MKFYQGTPPAGEAPPWAERIPRWQQMDATQRAVADAWYHWFGLNPEALPGQLIVALPAASNLADREFAGSGAFSPQKFVATLPSVASAPILQLTAGTLPVLCVQDGKNTFATALAEAQILQVQSGDTIGVLSVDPGLGVSYEEVGLC